MTGKTVAQRVQEAKSRIDNLTPDQVAAELAGGGVTLVDVRDAPELAGGAIAGAVHVSRGMLEFHADPASPYYKPELRPESSCTAHPGADRRWRFSRCTSWAMSTSRTSTVASRRGKLPASRSASRDRVRPRGDRCPLA